MTRRSLPLLLVLSACGSSPKDGQDLLGEVRLYAEGMRWRKYEDAAARIPAGEREAFLDQRESLDEELHIDDYEIDRVKLKEGKEGAIVLLKYTWHLDSVGVVYDTVVEQVWELRGVRWLRIAESRKRGERMPGVGERPNSGSSRVLGKMGKR